MSQRGRGTNGRASMMAALLVVAVGAGCGNDGDDSNSNPNPNTAVRQLFQSDMADLANLNSAGPAAYDASNGGTFTEIFGGTNAAAVESYYQARVKYVIMPDDNTSTITPDPTPLMSEPWLPSSSPSGEQSSGAQIGAQNLGTLFWLAGLVDNVQLTIDYLGTTEVAVDSSRVGLVLLGPAYEAQIQVSDESGATETVTLPPAFRQSILMHEARHSDCTGGLSQEQLQGMISATSYDEYISKFPSDACGHLHIVCPDSVKDLAGQFACDSEKWGAYTVGAIFAAATIDNYNDPTDRELMKMMALDAFSRFTGTDTSPAPDMSSAGLLPN